MKLLRMLGLATSIGLVLGVSAGADDLSGLTLLPDGFSQLEGANRFTPIPIPSPSMTVESNDPSIWGTSLLVINQAAPSGAGRAQVAALKVVAAGGQNAEEPQTGAYGAIVRSLHWRGLYAKGSSGFYAAVFDSNAGIELVGGGTCSGCSMAFKGINEGSEVIDTGDFVAVLGVGLDPDLSIPIMRVRKASDSSDVVVGVARSRMAQASKTVLDGMAKGDFDQTIGAVEPGAFLSVVVQGLVQANVGKISGLNLGDYLTTSTGDSVADASSPTIGRAMSEVSENGKVWIMLGQ